jgi:hypothetical protein
MKDYLGQEIKVGDFVVIIGTSSALTYDKEIAIVQKINEQKVTICRGKYFDRASVSSSSILVINEQLKLCTDQDVIGLIEKLKTVELNHEVATTKSKPSKYAVLVFPSSDRGYTYTLKKDELTEKDVITVVSFTNTQELFKKVNMFANDNNLKESPLYFVTKSGKFTKGYSFTDIKISAKKLKEYGFDTY